MTYFLADTENIADRWYGSALDAEPGDVFLLSTPTGAISGKALTYSPRRPFEA